MPSNKKSNRTVFFRLSLTDDDTHEEIRSVKFSRLGMITGIITIVVVFFAMAFSLIAFTPLRTLIPGYPDERTKHEAIVNAIRIDSLENVIVKWEFYSENLRRVVEGKEPLKIDSLMKIREKSGEAGEDKESLDRQDSLLKATVERESRFEIRSGDERRLPIEGQHFFCPLKGVISQGYDKALHPALDITAPENSVVMSVLDGTVIGAFWNDEDGYTIQIQHSGNIISIYKHNQKLMKQVKKSKLRRKNLLTSR